jgi:malonyl CoA-acyl carrier protein transacylase
VAASYASVLDGVEFRAPAIPVVANFTAKPYDASAVSSTLGSQIANSVRWLDSMIYMLDHGVTEFQEIGPGTVLAKLAAQIRKKRPA